MADEEDESLHADASGSSKCVADLVAETSNKMEGVETETQEGTLSVTNDEELRSPAGAAIPLMEIGHARAVELQEGSHEDGCGQMTESGDASSRKGAKSASQNVEGDADNGVGTAYLEITPQVHTIIDSTASRSSTDSETVSERAEKEVNLDEVYIHDNLHPLISDDIRRFKGLRVLKVFANEMRILPEGVEGLAKLEHLHFKTDTLNVGALPSLKSLRNLKALELYQVPPRMSSSNLPDDIAELVSLQRLAICHYSITALPSNLGLLSGLEELDLSFNRLVTLSPSIGNLSALRVLKLASNRLKELCQELSQLVKLNLLDVSHNRLSSLKPLRLATLTSLRTLNLEHNKLLVVEDLPEWIECGSDCNLGTQDYEGDQEEEESDEGDASESPHSSCTRLSNGDCLSPGADGVWSVDDSTKAQGLKLVSDVRPQKQLRGAGSLALPKDKDSQQRKARQEKLHERRCAGKPTPQRKEGPAANRRAGFCIRGIATVAVQGIDEQSASEVTTDDGMEGEFSESALNKKTVSLDQEEELQPEEQEGIKASAGARLLPGVLDSTELLPGEGSRSEEAHVRLLSGYNELASVVCVSKPNGGVDDNGEICTCYERLRRRRLGSFSEDDEAEDEQKSTAHDGEEDLGEGSGADEVDSGSGGAGPGVRRGRKDGPKCDRNPKPTKRRRHMRGSSGVSLKYYRESLCGFGDRLHDGFYDAGRERPFLPLHVLEQEAPVMNKREVILVDRARDEELDVLARHARALLSSNGNSGGSGGGEDSSQDCAAACPRCQRWTSEQILSASEMRTCVEKLALFVSDAFGGSERNSASLSTRLTALGQRVGREVVTARRGPPAFGWGRPAYHLLPRGLRTEVAGFLPKMDELCERAVNTVKSIVNSNVVPIGSLPFGICRHRAILFKYLCDRAHPIIPCELVRGYMDGVPHAWNVVGLRGSSADADGDADGDVVERLLVDVCRPFDMGPEDDPDKTSRYLPLQRIRLPWLRSCKTDLPKLVMHEEIGRGASGAIVRRCSFGPHVAAAKILRYPAFATSSCNGTSALPPGFPPIELRVLCRLPPHPCIIPYYGHRLRMFHPLTPSLVGQPGNASNTATEMMAHELILFTEMVEGGCLEEFIKNCQEEGLSHVPSDSAFVVAHGVAKGLAWVHGHGFLHRDIKSSNVLVDMVKSEAKQESLGGGTTATIVSIKLCDFSHAVALEEPTLVEVSPDNPVPVAGGPGQAGWCSGGVGRAFVMSSPDSFAGPDTCVGTAQWMAPEVLRAMYSRQRYSKPADIWSLGCLLCELLSLDRPYVGLSEVDTDAHIRMGRRPPLPPSLQHLVPESLAGSLLEAWKRHASTLSPSLMATARTSSSPSEGSSPSPGVPQLTRQQGDDSKRLELLVFLMAACTVPDPRERPTAEEVAALMALHASSQAPVPKKVVGDGGLGDVQVEGGRSKDCGGEKLGEAEVEPVVNAEEGGGEGGDHVSCCRVGVAELCQGKEDGGVKDAVEVEGSNVATGLQYEEETSAKVNSIEEGERKSSSLGVVEHEELLEQEEDVLIAL